MSTQESMREQLERPIAQLESLSQMLFSALASNQVPPDPPIEELAACDIMLAEGMRSARIHLLKQQKIDSLMDEVYELEAQLVEIVEYLAKGQRELQAIMEEGRDRLTTAEIATRAGVPYNSHVSYGMRLADYTSAPPNAPMDEDESKNEGIPYAFHPPFPETEVMQRGRLGLQDPIGPVGDAGYFASTISTDILDSTLPLQSRPGRERAPQRPERRAGVPNLDIFDLDLNPDLT